MFCHVKELLEGKNDVFSLLLLCQVKFFSSDKEGLGISDVYCIYISTVFGVLRKMCVEMF
jgi:hypothetical protein